MHRESYPVWKAKGVCLTEKGGRKTYDALMHQPSVSMEMCHGQGAFWMARQQM